jgi:HEAT repeat protein
VTKVDPYSIDEENQLTEDQRIRLFNEALRAKTDESRFRRIRVLHADGAQSTFDRAAEACRSTHPHSRMVGADVLSQLAYRSSKRFWKESIALLLTLLKDANAKVVQSAVFALGHLGSDHGSEMVNVGRELCRLVDHASADVREAVASGLEWFPEPADIVQQTLIALSRDRVGSVRDWACFSLRVQDSFDSVDTRDALFARLNDRHRDTRWEALAGLAKRADPRVRDRVLEAVKSGMDEVILPAFGDILEGAGQYHDPEICAALMSAREEGVYEESRLRDALARCNEANS